jgi:site-specific DNA recombinase
VTANAASLHQARTSPASRNETANAATDWVALKQRTPRASAVLKAILYAPDREAKNGLLALEAEKAELERTTVEPAMPTIHPNLAQHYRDLVQRLQNQLQEPELAATAKSMLRSLIKEIRISPGAKRGHCCLELVGKLATILNISLGARNKGGTPASQIQVSVVAGAGSHSCYNSRRIGSFLVPSGREIEDAHQLAA